MSAEDRNLESSSWHFALLDSFWRFFHTSDRGFLSGNDSSTQGALVFFCGCTCLVSFYRNTSFGFFYSTRITTRCARWQVRCTEHSEEHGKKKILFFRAGNGRTIRSVSCVRGKYSSVHGRGVSREGLKRLNPRPKILGKLQIFFKSVVFYGMSTEASNIHILIGH